MAVSALDCGLLPITQTSMRFAKIAYHDYKGVVLDLDMQESLVRDLGEHDAIILRNHGLLTCGRTVAEAFNALHRLELSCKTQIAAMSCGTKLYEVPQEVVDADLEQLPAEDPPPLRRDGMAGHAAQAGPHRPVLARLERSAAPTGQCKSASTGCRRAVLDAARPA